MILVRLLLQSILVAGLASCGASEDEKGGETEQQTQSSAEFVDPNPETRRWAESGDKVIDTNTEFKKGYVALSLKHDGTSNFSVWLVDPKGKQSDLLVNEIGAFEGVVAAELPEDGKYKLEVTADGAWTIETFAVKNGKSLPTSLSGKDYALSTIFYLQKDSSFKVKGTYDGTSNFIVTLISTVNGSMEDLIFNEINAYSGEKLVSADEAGFYFIAIEAREGNWNLDITE